MKTVYKFSEGYSLVYLAHSVLVMAISVALGGLVSWYFLAVGGFVIIALLSTRTGVKLDLKTNTFSSYKAMLGQEIHKPINLAQFKTGRLIFTNESNTYESRFNVNTIRSRTFDLELYVLNGEATHIYEFQDYHAARKIVDLLHQNLGIDIFDEWGETRAEAMRNKSGRRR